MTMLRAVQLTDSQKERRKRLVALANEALRAAGEPEQKFEVVYSALPTAVVMAVEHVKDSLDAAFFADFQQRFNTIIKEELAERHS
jgi:hypothetical protein